MKTNLTIGLVASALALAGCATNPETGERRIARPAATAAAGAGAGALLGALLGGRNNRAEVLIGTGVGAIAGGAVGSYMDKQARELKQRTAGTGIEVEQKGDEIAIKLPSGIAFDTGQATVRPDMRPALDNVAKTLASYQSTFVDVTGHTDSTGGDAINQPLSERRAAAVADYLQYQGVQRARMATKGYGAQFPVASNDSEDGRAKNRRVEIRLSPVTQADVPARP
ncbi:OmpA family protein [Sandarakinorhabdus oryzae]|uniref:OmpA family protein n=1 Tax=Sandarakinorhabdus oryzae TaxID=2675220 RepID=UPI0012E31A69|nr:OmpA family protein [Sandarakinorhabdus oryzae]